MSKHTDPCVRFFLYLYKGLASLRMDLSDEPTLGQWKIIVNVDDNRKEQTFTVDEYGTLLFYT